MILFTSDWQLTAKNLDTAAELERRIMRAHKDHQFKFLVHCGDVKHILNPIDGRVVNYLIEMVDRMQKHFPVTFLLGNHDKFSNQEEGKNFFPVLRAAGANAFDEPSTVTMGDFRVKFLPYNTNLKQAREDAAALAMKADPRGTILVMHETIVGASLNGRRADAGLTLEDIQADKYLHVISGHIHLPQQIGNVHYVGSPWCHDWGEVNQRKFFLLVSGKKIARIPVGLPGLYDPALKGFEPLPDYSGSTVRVTVSGPDEMLPRMREQALADAAKKYAGATILVNSLREDSGSTGSLKVSRDDGKTVRRYVKKAITPHLEDRADAMVSYLLSQLTAAGGAVRSGEGVTFLSAEGKNVLSFEKVSQKFEAGVTVVRGQSVDWKDRSNGAGKTNYLQLIALALTGDTMKGQRHDKWVRRGSTGEAFVKLAMKLSDGRLLEVERRRKPSAWLKMWVDGKPYHSGAGPTAAQKALEELTGFTRETLANSVYLDQGRVNYMLSGTDAERKTLLAKFLNLDRFTRAQDAVKAELKKVETSRLENERELHGVEQAGETLRATLAAWKEPDVDGLEKKLKAARKKREAFTAYVQKRKDAGTVKEKLESVAGSIGEYTAKIGEAEERLARVEKWGPSCSKCGQKIPASMKKATMSELEADIRKWTKAREELKQDRARLRKAVEDIEAHNSEEQRLYYKSRNEENLLISDEESCRDRLKEAGEELEKRDRIKEQLDAKRARYKQLKAALLDIEKETGFLAFAVAAFGKSGIPAFLMAEICPTLNAATEYYAGLIADSEIRVTFRQVGDDITVSVLNRHGGETLEDQSCGETRTASLIASLAIRETAVPCNLLIADEPGDGLDEEGAARLAQCLGTVAETFGCVYVISHNPNILAELEDYPQVIIEKSSGISKCV